ncbi:hypothetical protein [Streptomyces sp. NPDC053069]|uniref:hypothetical protein n=1 Tax=Streptomyces sp. NPDC053069 TaxID=3365695 RepID=UPI0037D4E2BC
MIQNRRLKRVSAVAGTLCAALLLTVTQANAAAREVDRATVTTHDGEWVKCASKGDNIYVGCYDPEGDWFLIQDEKADGYSAVVTWEVGDRWGDIFNADGAAAKRYMNKNFPEGATVRFRICLGHWDTKLVTSGTCSGWVSNPT